MSKSIKEYFQESLLQFHALEQSANRQDSEEYQTHLTTTIESFLNLKKLTSQLSIFSSNESLEDLNTSEIKYLSIDHYLAQLYAQLLKPSKKINLKKSIILNVRFLKDLNDYSLLDKPQATKFENLKDSPLDLHTLKDQTKITNRDEKITLFKKSKTLVAKLQYLEKLEKNSEEYEKVDEDVVRELYLAQLELFSMKTIDNLKLLSQELELLEMLPSVPKIEELKQQDHQDHQEKHQKNDPTGFTEKLEYKNKELLSKEGKILQPFTIVKRAELKKKVFGTGQYLPTMTVEEFLDWELANGGMVQGGAEQQEESEDEDDYEKCDRETYKKREWDEFTESVAKGSGNTTNRG